MIRKINKDDILKIVELENETLNTSLGANMLNDSLDNEMAYFFVDEEDNDILAYISTMFDGETVEILNFCVKAKLQHQGLGTKMLSFINNYFYNLKAKNMILEVRFNNIKAINIYKKFGFKQIHIRKNYYSNGDDALVLNKELISISDLYDSYILVNSKIEKYDDYYKLYDDVQKDKYYNNYFKIINPTKGLIDELKKKQFRDYFMIFSEAEIDEILDYKYEKDSLIYMYSSIYGLKPLKNNNYSVIKLNVNHADMLYNHVFDDSKEFGIEFAKGNALRNKDNLINNKFDYFSIIENDKIVANILVYQNNEAIFIEDVVTIEQYRHKGLCSAIFSYVIDYYKKIGIKDVALIADNDDTVKYMYEDMGFIKIGNCFAYRMV